VSMDRRVGPGFDANGNLPSGVHRMSLKSVARRFGWNAERRRLLSGLARAVSSLAAAGVKRVWVDGSFVTDTEEPNDIDGCWEYDPSVDVDKLDEVFLDLHPPREAMMRKYGVVFLISGTRLTNGALIELGEEA